ncbi:MAG: serpin family protein [Deltaproteobacteria bacterium]|nr:serpin family protein [Deltaproteobacteria bacterium]
MKKKIALMLLLLVLLLFSFPHLFPGTYRTWILKAPPMANDKRATKEGITAMVGANNRFAIEFYSQLKNKPGNLFFSPYSISTALAMLYEGARGTTATEIQTAVSLPGDGNIRKPAIAAIYNRLNPDDGDFTLRVANALWMQTGYDSIAQYKDDIQQYYCAKLGSVDFQNSPGKAISLINKWVAKSTNNKIAGILSEDNLNNQTKFIFINAIYFKGKWEQPFEKSDTVNKKFNIGQNNSVEVPMMNQEGFFRYSENDLFQSLEMPYKGDMLSMIILLPKKNDLPWFENNFTIETIIDLRKKLSELEVNVEIPKFRFDFGERLKKYLVPMGVKKAFSSGADFSGIEKGHELLLDEIFHKAYVDVNEEGTEAAAVTFGEKAEAPPPEPVKFIADHPFIFLIQDRTNGNILFIGRVVNPSLTGSDS